MEQWKWEKGSGITKQYFKEDQPQRYMENGIEREMRKCFAVILGKKVWIKMVEGIEEKRHMQESLHKEKL